MSFPNHSVSIEKAKAVNERIRGNYTSSQLIGLLDTFLFNALEPLVLHTNYFDRFLASLLTLSYGRKRRVSAHKDASVVYRYLAVALFSQSAEERMLAIQKAKIERGLLFLVIDGFLSATTSYIDLSIQAEKTSKAKRFRLRCELRNIERAVGAKSDLYPVIRSALMWSRMAAEFKQAIAEKYLRHAVNRSSTLNAKSGFFNIDLDDVMQNHALAISKAIDKFDVDKGTLTSYINNWFQDARYNKNHYIVTPDTNSLDEHSEYTADTLEEPGDDEASCQSDDMYNSSTTSFVQEIELRQEVDWVRQVARYADPTGLGRFALGIGEILTHDELKQLVPLVK